MKNLGMHLAAGSSKRNPLEIEKVSIYHNKVYVWLGFILSGLSLEV